MKNAKQLLGLLIHDGTDGEYHRLAITVVRIADRKNDRENATCLDDMATLRNVGDYLEDPMGGGLKDLQVAALLGRDPRSSINTALYGWRIGYRDSYFVELREAERMVKTLKTIGRKMDKVSADMGRPESFGAFVVRVADAVGAKHIISATHSTGRYDQGEYTFMTLLDGMEYINGLERKWVADIQKGAA